MYFRIPDSTRKKSSANVVTRKKKKDNVSPRHSLHNGGTQNKSKHKLVGSTEKNRNTDRKGRLLLTEEDLLPGLKHGEDERRLEPHAPSPEELTQLGLWTTCEGMIRSCGW